MGISINSSQTLHLLNIISSISARQNNLMSQLTTGKLINKGSDNPAGMIALSSMNAELTAVNAALGAEKSLIESVRVFDQFTGEKAEAQMGSGKKSIALTVRLQPTAATLTEAEIEAVSAKIIEKVTKATGGALRA